MHTLYLLCLLLVILPCISMAQSKKHIKMKFKLSTKEKKKSASATSLRHLRSAPMSEIPLRCDFKKYNTDDEEAFISRQEVYDLLSIFDGGPKTEQNVDLIFLRLDTNGDGKLAFEEFYLEHADNQGVEIVECPLVQLLEEEAEKNQDVSPIA